MNCPDCSQQFTYISNDKDLAQQQLEKQLKTHYQQKHRTKPLPTPPPLKSNDNPPPQPTSQPPSQPNIQPTQYLSILQAIQNYFLANNVQTISQDSNGNLIITFNQNNSPTQTITNQQLTSNNADMDNEQKDMWQRFKEYLKKKGKTKIDKQELTQEISNLTQSQNQPSKETNWTPWLIGGGIFLVLVIGIIVYFLTRNKKQVA